MIFHAFFPSSLLQKIRKNPVCCSKTIYYIKNRLFPVLYPRRCPICHALLPYGSYICSGCESSLPFIKSPACFCCGKPVSSPEQEYCYDCRIFPKSFRQGLALFIYNEITRPPMMMFKYKNERHLSFFFTTEIFKRHKKELKQWQLFAIIPIPLHKKKQKKRGYNQADLLAKDLAVLLDLPCYSDLLTRTIDTLPQKQFTPQERLNNMQTAFTIHPKYKKILPSLHSVLLIDDIYTTGATMETCTRILRDAGIKNVYIYSICIGISRD